MMQCSFTNETDGNPTVDRYVWYKEGNVSHTGTNDTWTVSIHSVNEEAEYSCQLGNTPDAEPQVGEISEAHSLLVKGIMYLCIII